MSDWTAEDAAQLKVLEAKRAIAVSEQKQSIRELLARLPDAEKHKLLAEYGYQPGHAFNHRGGGV